ncbi:MAG: EAL domain-containing protein [Gammaproteobacteria bacterium]|nr:EAL domain-containing protein [Gammaproteobacteria bacterium]
MKGSELKADLQGDFLLFADDAGQKEGANSNTTDKSIQQPWKIMVIDDDEVVHQVTAIVLEDFYYQGRPLQMIQGYSGEEARKLIKENPDTAVMLLDVVMETDTAGLDTVKYIRDELNNHFVRIILRTGQPGQAPEKEVITEFDINDYKEKTELTAQKLYTSIITALRAFSDLKKIQDLAVNNINLEQRVRERTLEMMKVNEELKGEVVERNKAYKKLQESEARLNEAQRIARIGSWEWDIGTDEIIWSDQIFKIIRIQPSTPGETFKDMLDVVIDDDRNLVEEAFRNSLETGLPYDIEHRIIRDDGQLRFVHQQGQVDRNEKGEAVRMAGTLQDITLRYQTEEQMRKLSGAVEQIADAVMITDYDGTIEYINPAYELMTGYSKEEIIGNTPAILKSDKQPASYYERLWKTILSGEIFSDVVINKKKNGEYFYEEKTITPQKDRHGNIVHFISTGKDVTERIEAQERLHFMAHHDSLTGLPNRVLLQDRLSQVLARGPWNGRNIAVMFMDIDRFKVINDSLGHDAGDDLLKEVSQRLLACVREGDTVARLGGDEFAIVLNDIASSNDVIPIAEKILDELRKPVVIKQHELFVTSSIGISLFPRDGKECQELLKKADVAMYRAKANGKDNYQLYTGDDESLGISRLSMETQLRRALDRDEFQLYFQPQVRIQDNNIIGFEALLRWFNDDLPNVSPFQFIPILEETGMINEVGDWVLKTACIQEKAWQLAGLPAKRIAVNLSIRQFKSQGLVKRIEQILSRSGLAPQYLELELTEGLLVDQIKETSNVLNELHEMGVKLSIDDFGTGYSSMNYLKRLPFDILKIDRMFVRDVTFNPDDAAIASAIISLGHTMGMEVVAEGVETNEQLEYLREQGCDAIQGYLYSPPLAAEAIMALINEGGGPNLIQVDRD